MYSLNEDVVRAATQAMFRSPSSVGPFSLQHRMERTGLIEHQRGAAMLVLSRKKNESIIINDNITVTVIEIRGDKVRLGIEAPKHVTVHRREVYEAIQNQARSLDEGAKVSQSEP